VLSIAFARRAVDGFYPRLGYLGLGCHPELVVPAVALAGGARPAGVTQGFEAGEIDAYDAAYRATYGALPFAFARDAAWWALFPLRLEGRVSPDGFRTVRAGGRVVGYFVAQGSRVIEAAAVDGGAAALEAALPTARAESDLVLALPPAHPFLPPWRRRNHTERVRYAWDGGHVARVLDGRRLAPGLARATGGDDAGAAAANLHDHAAARRVLERVAGVADGPRRLAALPAWSPVDEF
jgi:hypothetical protein